MLIFQQEVLDTKFATKRLDYQLKSEMIQSNEIIRFNRINIVEIYLLRCISGECDMIANIRKPEK